MSAGTVGEPSADAELWGRAAGGDRTAFGELFERHAQAVWNHAYRLTGSWAQAEDLTSATFLTAWRRRERVTLVHDSALPWLYAVAGNLARTERRSGARRLRLLRKVPPAGDHPDHADSVADRLDGERRLTTVVAAIRELPAAQRRVAELCLLGELPTADVAELLGTAEVTVRTNLSRARARLRSRLEEK
ncbi:RNA polymerase sigma factor [Amycolatopsis suaedae]|uniref:RNA polymerase sigma factor n=1 Tax=Amycolatopsis suaedae TaxID=2510978 RepID=A0A4V2ELN4_9PSEU|nr:RNA polymerase sigma factor [Amycolatopsis suaedae]RZQ62175.1 RNA polymerase sigma factor [Amycolatopsis suaedae]